MVYFRPQTVDEALEIIGGNTGLMPVAGCTDVSVGREEGVLKADSFLDLSLLNELKKIYKEDGYIVIGALATHGEIAASELIKSEAGVLSSACICVGSPQVRNRGTIGGNICHASPSGDSIPPLMALDAEFLLEKSGEKRWVKSTEFFTGPGKTVRQKDEILTNIRFKPAGGCRHYFKKLGQRKSLACSKASMATVMSIDGNKVSLIRIAMGAVGPTVLRAYKTEELLKGKELTAEIMDEACKLVCEEATPIDDLRSTAEYRKQMMGELLKRSPL